MPCTSTGTLKITPLDSMSTVTAPSSSSSVTQVPILSSPPFSSPSMDSSVSLLSLLFSSPIDSSLEDSLTRLAPSNITRPSGLLESGGSREVEDDPPDSRSPEGRVKFEGASQGYEFSSEESEGEETNREVEPSGGSPTSLSTRRRLSC
jgi:hypothetical protein